METKFCSKCQQEKPITEFYKYKRRTVYQGKRKVSEYVYEKTESYCKSCQLVKKNIQKRRKRYGLTPNDLQNLVIGQENKCAICGCIMPFVCVDHDHNTGIVRGLLCNACNLALGGFQDSIAIVQSALDYLIKNRKEN